MKRLHPLFFFVVALLLAACGSRNAASLDDFTVAVSTPEAPFGGIGMSGHGSEGGTEGLQAYLHTKLASIA